MAQRSAPRFASGHLARCERGHPIRAAGIHRAWPRSNGCSNQCRCAIVRRKADPNISSDTGSACICSGRDTGRPGAFFILRKEHTKRSAACRETAKVLKSAAQAAQDLAAAGERVLAVAEADFPVDPGQKPDQVRYRLIGLLGFEDPVQSDVPSAIAAAALAGVSVAMITGDYPATARAIASAAGIDVSQG